MIAGVDGEDVVVLEHHARLGVVLHVILIKFVRERQNFIHSKCVMDRDKLRQMIIFSSISTIFEAITIFEASGVVSKFGSTLKNETTTVKLI